MSMCRVSSSEESALLIQERVDRKNENMSDTATEEHGVASFQTFEVRFLVLNAFFLWI